MNTKRYSKEDVDSAYKRGFNSAIRLDKNEIKRIIMKSEWIHPKLRNKVYEELLEEKKEASKQTEGVLK